LVAGNLWAAELASGKTIEEVGDRLDGDVLGADWVAAYDASATAATEAFDAAGALEAACAVSDGPVPGAMCLGHRFIDVFVHGWDLAVAVHCDTMLDPDLVDGCLAVVGPQAELSKANGAFGSAAVEPYGRWLAGSTAGAPRTSLLNSPLRAWRGRRWLLEYWCCRRWV
jgi:uncharacterized protein (TIGR03086 family)